MKKRNVKFVCLIIAVFMMLSIMPINVWAVDEVAGYNVIVSINEGVCIERGLNCLPGFHSWFLDDLEYYSGIEDDDYCSKNGVYKHYICKIIWCSATKTEEQIYSNSILHAKSANWKPWTYNTHYKSCFKCAKMWHEYHLITGPIGGRYCIKCGLTGF